MAQKIKYLVISFLVTLAVGLFLTKGEFTFDSTFVLGEDLASFPYAMIILGISFLVYPYVKFLLRTMILPGLISTSLIYLLVYSLCGTSDTIRTAVWFVPELCSMIVARIGMLFPMLTQGITQSHTESMLLCSLFYCIGLIEILSIAISAVDAARSMNTAGGF